MKREKLIREAYDHSSTLHMKNRSYRKAVQEFFEKRFAQDVGSGDATIHAVLPNRVSVQAYIYTKKGGVIAGLDEVNQFYKDSGIVRRAHRSYDGFRVQDGELILDLQGDAQQLLSVERVTLDVLQVMSGIATATNDLVRKLKPNVYLAGTRKTRFDPWMEKRAVALGGGLTHRLGLENAVMIKENTLTSVQRELGVDRSEAIEVGIRRVYESSQVRAIEIEVENSEEARIAARVFSEYGGLKGEKIPIIMFDNFGPAQIAPLVPELRFVALLEASGGITPETIQLYAQSGVDVISTSYMQRCALPLDLSLIVRDRMYQW